MLPPSIAIVLGVFVRVFFIPIKFIWKSLMSLSFTTNPFGRARTFTHTHSLIKKFNNNNTNIVYCDQARAMLPKANYVPYRGYGCWYAQVCNRSRPLPNVNKSSDGAIFHNLWTNLRFAGVHLCDQHRPITVVNYFYCCVKLSSC